MRLFMRQKPSTGNTYVAILPHALFDLFLARDDINPPQSSKHGLNSLGEMPHATARIYFIAECAVLLLLLMLRSGRRSVTGESVQLVNDVTHWNAA